VDYSSIASEFYYQSVADIRIGATDVAKWVTFVPTSLYYSRAVKVLHYLWNIKFIYLFIYLFYVF
jgi:hypothetical protein